MTTPKTLDERIDIHYFDKPPETPWAPLIASQFTEERREKPVSEYTKKQATDAKNDESKLPLGLIPKEALDGLARGLQFGAKKHGKYSWAEGKDWSDSYNAAMRHLTAWNAGQNIDPDSGLSHLDLAICRIAFLLAYETRGIGNDDRYKE